MSADAFVADPTVYGLHMTMTRRSWVARPRHYVPLAILALGVVAAIVWTFSPWPAALLIRALFEQGAAKTVAVMDKYIPRGGVLAQVNQDYGHAGSDTAFDVFSPASSTGPLPTVVWIHGGAWISGSKDDVDPYAQIIAEHGYTTVTLNYTPSPEATYPTALHQLNTALGYLVQHSADYRIDPNRIVIAGDSAGANLASQLATEVTSPDYANLVDVHPSITAQHLRGLVLNCGI